MTLLTYRHDIGLPPIEEAFGDRAFKTITESVNYGPDAERVFPKWQCHDMTLFLVQVLDTWTQCVKWQKNSKM